MRPVWRRKAMGVRRGEHGFRPPVSVVPPCPGITGFLARREGRVPETGVFSDLEDVASRNWRPSRRWRLRSRGTSRIPGHASPRAGERRHFRDGASSHGEKPNNSRTTATPSWRTPLIPRRGGAAEATGRIRPQNYGFVLRGTFLLLGTPVSGASVAVLGNNFYAPHPSGAEKDRQTAVLLQNAQVAGNNLMGFSAQHKTCFPKPRGLAQMRRPSNNERARPARYHLSGRRPRSSSRG